MINKKICDLFSRDKNYHFARWSKPLSPVIFGVDDQSLIAIKSAFSEVLSIASLELTDFDSDLGANLLVFFCSTWSELETVPHLNRLLPDISNLLETLDQTNANQYRSFSFKADGAINLVVVLLKYDTELSSVSIQTLALSQMLQSILLWSPNAFVDESPISIIKKTNRCVVKPFYSALIQAAYDPILPDSSLDESHAFRLEARVNILMETN